MSTPSAHSITNKRADQGVVCWRKLMNSRSRPDRGRSLLVDTQTAAGLVDSFNSRSARNQSSSS